MALGKGPAWDAPAQTDDLPARIGRTARRGNYARTVPKSEMRASEDPGSPRYRTIRMHSKHHPRTLPYLYRVAAYKRFSMSQCGMVIGEFVLARAFERSLGFA